MNFQLFDRFLLTFPVYYKKRFHLPPSEMQTPSFVSGAPPCKQAYVMWRPVQNTRGDGRRGFWEEDGRVAPVRVRVPGGELRRVIYLCSVDMLPDPGQVSQPSSVLLAFSVKYGLSHVTASQGRVKLLRSP